MTYKVGGVDLEHFSQSSRKKIEGLIYVIYLLLYNLTQALLMDLSTSNTVIHSFVRTRPFCPYI